MSQITRVIKCNKKNVMVGACHNIMLILSACFVFSNVHFKWGFCRFGETTESKA